MSTIKTKRIRLNEESRARPMVRGLILAILGVLFCFAMVGEPTAKAQASPQDRALIRAMERQADAQEKQAESLKQIERHLEKIARGAMSKAHGIGRDPS